MAIKLIIHWNASPQVLCLRWWSPLCPKSGKPTWWYGEFLLRLWNHQVRTTWVSYRAPESEVCSNCSCRLGYWQHRARHCTDQCLFWAHVPARDRAVKKTCPDLVSNLVLHTRLRINIGSSLQLQLQSLRSTGYKPVGWERILLLNEKADRLIVCRESFKIFRLLTRQMQVFASQRILNCSQF